jgi:hypothetical protein
VRKPFDLANARMLAQSLPVGYPAIARMLELFTQALDEIDHLRAEANRERELGAARFCAALDEWAALMGGQKDDVGTADADNFNNSWRGLRFMISKSCLLSRTIYLGLNPSKTPCPVHEGRWAGVHGGWPGQFWLNPKTQERTPAVVHEQQQKWYDEGCRCYMHGCGCTTGWQPDEHSHPDGLPAGMK